jgi:two-component sensor histidine kinase
MVILSSNALGQYNYSNQNIDSLRKKSIDFLVDRNYVQANEILSELIDRKSELAPKLVPTVYNNKGIALYGIGKYVEGIKYYKLALSEYKRTGRDTLHAQALVNLGMAYREVGADSLASRMIYQAIDKFQKLNLEKEEASAFNSLGNMYRDAKKYKRSEQYLRKGLIIRERIRYEKGVAYSYHGLGRLKIAEEKFEEAKDFFFKSLRIKNSLGLEQKSASTLSQLGVLFLETSNCDSAKFYMNRSIEIRQKSKSPNRLKIALNNLHLGQIHLECGDPKESQLYFLQAQNELYALNAQKDLLLAYEGLMKAYKETGDFENAYSVSLKLLDLKEEVLSMNSQKELARLSIEYDVKGFQREIELQEIENDYLVKRNRTFLTVSIILLTLLGLIVWLLRQNIKRKRKIVVQNRALISKNRNIITLHEELSHRTNNYFSLIRGMILSDRTLENDALIAQQISRMDAMAEVQKHLIIDDNNSFSSVDLTTYIRELIDQSKIVYAAKGPLKFIEKINTPDTIIVHYEIAARLGIVLNELINNSLKHNKEADNLRINMDIEQSDGALNFAYSDSGKTEDTNMDNGKGLTLIEQLLLPVKGAVVFDWSENCDVKISIPIKEKGRLN